MYIGADYYPEHWSRERWDVDAELMRKAQFNVVRLAEFAWVNMEPEEGRFDFSWLEEALDVLHRRGISALLCTPTAVMPAWVARKYPETLAMQRDGQRIVWGVRKNNCFSSGTYRLLSERITRAMADHFADHPAVIGWQTDNEFGHPVCFCDSCRSEFQDWLRERHGSLEALNAAWGTHFWGHGVKTWGEIQIPVDPGSHNPGACLDWQRFFSWLNVRFQHDQVVILRERCPKHFITHNFMGLFPELNYYDLAGDLDMVSWDNYPVWGKLDVPYDASMAADLMRGLKRRNFWIMEQTSGPGGWGSFGRNPRPGEIRKIAYQQLAHGADAQVWFRWRTCTVGREQYWHGLLGHDGVPARRYEEAARTAGEYHGLAEELGGTTVKAQVAFVHDYDSLWALRIQPGFAGSSHQDALRRFYRAMFRAGVNADMIPVSADFSAYRLIVAPALHVLPDEVAIRLTEFVRAGGVLLTDCRTGVKDAHNRCHERTLPGLLSEALGVKIQEYEALDAADTIPVTFSDPAFGGTFHASAYVDWMMREGAESLGGYDAPYLNGYSAVTRNRFGRGIAYYVGTVFREDAFYDCLAGDALSAAGIQPEVAPPEGVEVSVREGGGRRLLFVLNHTDVEKTVRVPAGRRELLRGVQTGDSLKLEGFGVAVIKLA